MERSVGRLFIPDRKEALLCSWRLEGWHLVLTPTAERGADWTLNLQQAELTLGGFNEDQLVLKDAGLTFYCSRADLEGDLRALGWSHLNQKLGREHLRVQRSGRRAWAWLGVILVLLGLGGAAAWWLSDRIVERAAALSPVAWDVELGQLAWKLQAAAAPEVNDPRVVAPVQQLVEKLTGPYRNQGFCFQVHVLDSPEVNAFALPGGEIAVYTGLLQAAAGPEEVAGVLAHEIQHVVRRHGLRSIYGELRWQLALFLIVGDGSGLHAQLLGSSARLAGLSYSRDLENEADREGLRLLQSQGLEDHGMVSFFQKLDAQQGRFEASMKYLSTHPPSAERMEALQRMSQAAPPRTDIPGDWAGLKAALKEG